MCTVLTDRAIAMNANAPSVLYRFSRTARMRRVDRNHLAAALTNASLRKEIPSMTEKDHYKYGLSGDKVDVEVAERLRAQIRTQRSRIRQLEAALREIATIEPGAECQVGCDQIARKALATAETKGDQG